MTRISCAALALIALTTPALAESTISIANVQAFETAPTAMAGGGFMEITNTGTTDDRLIAVEAEFPRVEIHTTEFDADGVAKMIHIDAIDVPAGETVTLKPGGLHVMFMGLRGDPLEVGETVPATLIFEQAGAVSVSFSVIARDMKTHNH